MDFDKLYELKDQKGVSLKHLCDIVGVRRTYIGESKIRNVEPPMEYIAAWAADLGVSVSYLMGETDIPDETKKQPRVDSGLPDDIADINDLVELCKTHPGLASAVVALARQLVNGTAAPGSSDQ